MTKNRLFRWIYLCALLTCSGSGHAGTLATFRTALGDLDVELFDEDKPVTVRNFLRYIQSGGYTNMFIHRWVPGFVMQGGGFFTATRSNTNFIAAVPVFEPITNEFEVGRRFSNNHGTLAMARVGGLTNSATSQWFFNLANNAGLDSVDGGFTVFGRILRGTNVLNRFNKVSASNGIYRVALGDPLNELPVLAPIPTFQDLIYVAISPLTVRLVSGTNGDAAIAWLSVSNQPNHLEFTTKLPPVWRTLMSTNGTGAVIEVQDPDRAGGLRFYRVRVDF